MIKAINSSIKWIIFSALWLIAACGIEAPEPIRDLNPPLGLTVSLESNKIKLEFYALNSEPYISGYWIYVADTDTPLKQNTGTKLPNKEGLSDKPTVWQGVVPSTVAVKYTFYMEREPDYSPLELDMDYFFTVKAYSIEYNLYSDRSNITNITYNTNS